MRKKRVRIRIRRALPLPAFVSSVPSVVNSYFFVGDGADLPPLPSFFQTTVSSE
jgi:hypothetical protein